MNGLISSMTIGMAGGPGGKSQSPGLMIGWLLIMVALFYFMLIRPQQRKEKERKNLINAVKTGDRVIFGGGLIGVVTNVKENSLTIKIADNTKIDAVRAAVTRVLQKDEDLSSDKKE